MGITRDRKGFQRIKLVLSPGTNSSVCFHMFACVLDCQAEIPSKQLDICVWGGPRGNVRARDILAAVLCCHELENCWRVMTLTL